MNKTYILILTVIVFVISIGLFYAVKSKNTKSNKVKAENESSVHSQYAGQELRGIKALSEKDVEGLLAGSGTPFGGMAKPAELNGYPGPRHLLDAIDAGEFEVSEKQHEDIKSLYNEMKAQAVELGEKIIIKEQELDNAFSEKNVTESYLEQKTAESSELYGQLRFVHLRYHLATVDILSAEQVELYNELRGYTEGGDPCENVPEGHDSELWKMHNGCD